jgi:hypothetical protein
MLRRENQWLTKWGETNHEFSGMLQGRGAIGSAIEFTKLSDGSLPRFGWLALYLASELYGISGLIRLGCYLEGFFIGIYPSGDIVFTTFYLHVHLCGLTLVIYFRYGSRALDNKKLRWASSLTITTIISDEWL